MTGRVTGCMKRRDVLTAVATTSGVLVAGCVTGGTDGPAGDPADASTDDTDEDEGSVNSSEGGSNSNQTTRETDDDSGDEREGDETPNDAGNESDGDDETVTAATVAAAQIETTNTNCGGVGNRSEWTREGETLTVTGSFQAPTPCHKAVLTDIMYQDGTFDVHVGREPTSRECIQCVGSVSYTLTIEVADGTTVENVAVTHPE